MNDCMQINDNVFWWKQLPENFKTLTSGNSELNFLFQEGKIFVMDNHLAAGWCWLHSLNKNESYKFFHIDQHDDLVNDPNNPLPQLKDVVSITLEDYLSMSSMLLSK